MPTSTSSHCDAIAPVDVGIGAPSETRAAAGAVSLGCALVDSQSTIVSVRSTSPAKLIVGTPRGVCARAWLTTFGGGLVAGDRIALDLDVGPQARLLLSTQASTKVFRSSDDAVATQTVAARVAAGGVLAHLPDPVAPFAESAFAQEQTYQLGDGAGLALLDGLTSGRASRGERWAFRRVTSRLAIHGPRRAIVRDALDLKGVALEQLHRFDAIATLWLVGRPFASVATAVATAIAALPLRGPLIAACSPLHRDPAGGIVVRYAADHPERIADAIRAHTAGLVDILGIDPWNRRN